MADRDRHRERDRDRDYRDRNRDRDRRRDKEDRDKDRDRERDRTRSKRARSRSRTPDTRSHRRHRHQRTPSPSPPSKRHRQQSDGNDEKQVSDFLDKIAREQMETTAKKKVEEKDKDNGVADVAEDEMEMMKMLGIPTGFDSTKGKPVPGADVSGVRAVTKRQPRQYMNRRGGFNRPLPAERNR